MKYLLIAALVTGVCASSAAAQNRVELYADTQMSTCSISEPISPPIVQVHAFLKAQGLVTGVRFKAPKPDCWVGATWLGDASIYGGIGNSQSDWSVGFGQCLTGDSGVHIGAMSYLISGQALACCVVDALPAIQFVYTDCASPFFLEHPLSPSKPLIVNPDNTCGCQGGIVLRTESTTWGRVKSLYR